MSNGYFDFAFDAPRSLERAQLSFWDDTVLTARLWRPSPTGAVHTTPEWTQGGPISGGLILGTHAAIISLPQRRPA
jgi:hypothetical protein